MSEQPKESKLGRKLLIGVLAAALIGFGLITAAVLSLSSAIGEDNTSQALENAGFGGGLAASADIPDWLRPIIIDAVAKYGCTEVTPSLIAAQLYQESGFRTNPPDGGAGALGIAQFIPGTWTAEGIDGNNDGKKDPLEPQDAVPAMVSYDCKLADAVRQVPGDVVDNMLAAYNAGAYAVQKYGGIPPYEETRNYVSEIRERAEQWTAAEDGQVSGGLDKVVAAAKKALGTPYLFGGNCRPPFTEGADRCDCSSLVKYAWSTVGVNLPRDTYGQVKVGSTVKSVKDLRPGDLLFSGGSASAPEHVAMYIGGSQAIDAPHTGATVRIKPLSYWTSQILVMKRPPYTDPSTSTSGTWVAPVTNTTLGTPYHATGSMWSSGYHTGVDFPVPTGTPIRAVGPGTVVTAGWSAAYGYQVVIKHADGRYSQYAHQSRLAVSAGQKVSGGQRIGYSGATGNVSGPHLHFEIRTGPEYGSDIDPLKYLRSHGVKM